MRPKDAANRGCRNPERPATKTDAPKPLHDRLLLTVEEAGATLGVGRSLMYELIAKGEIRTVRIGRLRRIRHDDLGDFVDRLAG